MDPESIKTFLVTLPRMPVDKKVKLYIQLREAKAKAKKASDATDEQYKLIMSTLENHLLADADAQHVTGFKTEHGTTYTGEVATMTIADHAAFWEFMKQENDQEFLQQRVGVKRVETWTKEHEGRVPPGINVFRERVMRVRKSGEKE